MQYNFHAKYRARSLKSFNTLPLVFILRIVIGLVITLLTVVLSAEFEALTKAIVLMPYLPFLISIILLFKKKLAFRIWYIIGAVSNILFTYYTNGLPVLLIIIEALIILWMFTSFKKTEEA